MNKYILLLFFSFSLFNYAQDSLPKVNASNSKLKVKHFIIPTVLMTSGLILRDADLKKDVYEFHTNALGNRFRFKGDDYLQCAPTTLAVLGKYMGFQSENSWEQLCTNQIVSLTISGLISRTIKQEVNDKRPELYGVRSFPSGHTTTVFNAATLMFLEFKDDNIWFASSGYLFATATAFFRVTNEKHWVADVSFGAGLGMATAFIVHYWSPNLYKYVEKYIYKPKNKNITFLPYPVIQNNNYGMGLVLNLK